MTNYDNATAARRLGMKTSEIAEVRDTDAGTIIVTADGAQLIDVPADRPDAAGNTGLMLFAPSPAAARSTNWPVFSQLEQLAADDEHDGAVPEGTIKDVLAWVGDDPARAARALEHEHGAGKPRASLVEQLEQLAADDEHDGND